jgi:hypothetical protein
MINERFARTWRIGLFNLMRRSAELSVRGIEMIKFSDYLHSLYVPTNLNLIKLQAAARHRPDRVRADAGVRHGGQLLRRRRPLPTPDRRAASSPPPRCG